MRAKRFIVACSILLLAALACNLPGSQSANQPDLAATITAQALTLQATGSTPVTAATGTPSGAQASVTSATNCRTGPSAAYDLVLTVNPGQTYQVIGKNSSTNYWIVTNPAGGSCWLWGQNAQVTGDTASLPEYPAPPAPQANNPPKPTKTPKPNNPTATATKASGGGNIFPVLTFRPKPILLLPSAPGNLTQNRSCSEYFQGITPMWAEAATLTWQASAGQTGYRIYKGGVAISTIPATATSYHITLNYQTGTGGALYDTFGVEAYNTAGASQRPSIDVPRCP